MSKIHTDLPNHKNPERMKIMKNIKIILAAAILTILAASCGNSNNDDMIPDVSPTAGLTPTPAITPTYTSSPSTANPDGDNSNSGEKVGDDLAGAADSAGNAVKEGADAVGDAAKGVVDTVTGNKK